MHAAGVRYGEPTLLATGLEGLARVAVSLGHWDEANTLLNEAADLRQATARPALPHERIELGGLLDQIGTAGEAVRLGTTQAALDPQPEQLTSQ